MMVITDNNCEFVIDGELIDSDCECLIIVTNDNDCK